MKKLVSILLALTVCATLVAVVWANAGSVTVVSDTSVDVYGPLSSYAPLADSAWGSSSKAMATWVHSAWPWKTDPDGATWISSSYYVEVPYSANSWRWFHDEMTLPCTAYNISDGVVSATSDNAEEFYFNGVFVGSDGEVQGPFVDDHEWNTIINYAISPQPGVNELDFIVRNYQGTDSPTANPTGLIYKATVNYEVPDVIWQPPVTNDAFELKDGTTLPLKFKLYMQDGTLITSMQNVYMMVHGPSDGGLGPGIVRWDLGDGVDSLRFDYCEYYYIANFQTRDQGLVEGAWYTAVVHDSCTDQILGTIEFTVSASKGASRGNK